MCFAGAWFGRCARALVINIRDVILARCNLEFIIASLNLRADGFIEWGTEIQEESNFFGQLMINTLLAVNAL